MPKIGVARRWILSIAVPLLLIVSTYRIETRVNERPASEASGFAEAFAVAMRGKSATLYDTFAPRDAWWYWPGIIVLSTAWLWALWGPSSQGVAVSNRAA